MIKSQYLKIPTLSLLLILSTDPTLGAEVKVTSRGVQASQPVLGFIYDRTANEVQPLTGIPGAVSLGSGLKMDVDAAKFWMSPGGSVALLETSNPPGVVLAKLLNPAFTQRIANVPGGAEQVAFSPSGHAAALYYSSEKIVRVLTGLPANPVLSGAIDTSSLSASLTALAIADGAEIILAAVSDGGAGSIYLLSPGADMRTLVSGGHFPAIAFLRDRNEAVITDDLWNRVILIRDVAGGANSVNLADSSAGIATPVALGLSLDNRTAVVANAASGTVATIDLESMIVRLLPCNCQLTGLHQLAGNAVFRLTDLSGGSMVIFDKDGAESRIVVGARGQR